jgi:membrane-bound ClpP family serine protease
VEDNAIGDLIKGVLAFASIIVMFWSLRRRIAGLEGVVTEEAGPYALIIVNGQKWRAVAADGAPLRPGERVTVLSVQGLQLAVVSRETSAASPVDAR